MSLHFALILSIIIFCVVTDTKRPNLGQNLKAFTTRFCLTPFKWNSAFITGSSLCLKISLKTFNNYSPVTLAHEQRFNHMSLNSKIKTYRLSFTVKPVLRCFDIVFQRPYRYFSIALKVTLSLSDRYRIFTNDLLWIEIC